MITCEHVEKRFGRVVALDRVSLRIEAGERVALIGTNGSGKTSLLRAIVGLLRVRGRIEIAGVDVGRSPERALRSLAYMPQTTPPLEAPVAELVQAICALRGARAERVGEGARRLGLELAPLASVRVRDLSGGMKQKLAAALALASDAPLLVCDEPTASLDCDARSALFTLLSERPRASSLLLCSHRLEEVESLVERVIELRDGKVVYDGRLARTRPGVASVELERVEPLRRIG